MQELVLQDNFIGAWFLEDISICDRLIDHYESNIIRVTEGKLGAFGEVNHKYKKCNEMHFNKEEELIKEYVDVQLQKVCDEYIKKYEYCNGYSAWTIIDDIKIQKYEPEEGYYIWHCERDSCADFFTSRHLVFLTYLNDVTDEGETEFFYQKMKVRPQKGLTLIWPADWTHTHRGVASMSQQKYIITGWYNYI
jgi:prolyl 4-hydroxylase